MVGPKNCALVALVACLPVAVCAPLASAAQAGPAITHPQDDWAGSQIERYEGAATQDEPVQVSPGQGDTRPGDIAGLGVDPTDGSPIGTAPPPKSTPPKPAPPKTPPKPSGLDVSSHQGNVNWAAVAGGFAAFGYVKATEGTSYANPYFKQQYNGAYNAGLIRGAYHFATPNTSTGAAQANWFVSHGGGWSRDGRTLPPAIDLEYNPYGPTCYGMTPAMLVAWVHDFVNTVHARTGRYPTIYTSTRWWAMCMGNDPGFGADPLWIARYNTVLGTLPPGWRTQAIWQFADAGRFPGDQDSFNGTMDQLRALASG